VSDPLGLDSDARRRLRHDLRTPLTIIVGFAEVLASDRQLSEEKRRDYAERISEAADELKTMLDKVLDRPLTPPGGP
jgi:signal transduction histidine kinase